MPKYGARGHRSSCCMGSPRPAGSGSFRRPSGRTHTLVALDLPGHGGSGSVRADLPTAGSHGGRGGQGHRGPGTLHLARLFAWCSGGPSCPNGDGSVPEPGGLHRCDRRNRGSRSTCPSAPGRRGVADRLETSGDVEGFLDDWLRGPLFGRLPMEAADDPNASETARRDSHRACGCVEPAPRSPAGIASRRSAALSWPWREPTTPLRGPRASGSPPAPNAVASLVPGGGHAVHLPQPDRRGGSCSHWLDPVRSNLI